MESWNDFLVPAIPPKRPIKSRQGREAGESDSVQVGYGTKVSTRQKRLLLPQEYPPSPHIFWGNLEKIVDKEEEKGLQCKEKKMVSKAVLKNKNDQSLEDDGDSEVKDEKKPEAPVNKDDESCDYEEVEATIADEEGSDDEDSDDDNEEDATKKAVHEVKDENDSDDKKETEYSTTEVIKAKYDSDDNNEDDDNEKLVKKSEDEGFEREAQMAKIALQYRKMTKKRSAKQPPFTLVTANVYPSCACQGLKNGCRTPNCTCIYFGQECQGVCGCMGKCPNKALTRGEKKKLKIGKSQVQGAGCFTMEDLKKGEYVAEYLGEIVSRAEQEKQKNSSKFLFEIGDKDFLLDGSRFGSELAKMNHRPEKEANCEFKLKRVAGEWRVGVWAVRDIGLGEELFAYYGELYRGHGLITPYLKKARLVDS